MADEVAAQIQFEISQLNRLLASYTDLLRQVRERPPSLVEVTAVAAVLHSFYTGVENIFTVVAKRVDGVMPSGKAWHRELLVRMVQPTEKRGAVISPDLQQELAGYLSFRHRYRHAYSFYLDWDEMEKLVLPLSTLLERVQRELDIFLQGVEHGEQT